MEERVIELLRKLKMKKSLSFEQIAERLEITDQEELLELKDILDKNVNNYNIFHTDLNTYKLMSKTSFRKGVFHANKSGGGSVLIVTSYDKDGEHIVLQKEFLIKSEFANGAINNDEVLIEINLRNSEDINARVYKVIGRKLDTIYGKVETMGSSTFIRPIDKKLKGIKVFVEGDYLEGQLVEVKLDKQTANDFYIGTIIRQFNFHDDPKEDILIEAFMNGIDDKFSEEAIKQTEYIPDKVLDNDFIGRQDLRDLETFTIDGIDTNDIDDAISCIKLDNGNYELTVSIADVSHYVPLNSPLDLDARRKGTSNYLAGTVIPMLPRKLSNGICSLNPNVDRCAMSVRMEIDKNGDVVRGDIFPSIIHSDIKMNYDTVNNILYNRFNDHNFPKEYKDFENTLKIMYKLSLILRNKRIRNGAIEFYKPEMKVILDEDGRPIKVDKRVQDIAENLIEEFMIVANVSVFSLLSNYDIPADYRTHDVPNEDKIIDFFRLLNTIGIPYEDHSPQECVDDPKALQDLIDYISKECDPKLSIMLNTNLIKCMSRAKYSVNNIGHNGLAEKNYGHFTSPIRRYPDLTVHRIIKDCYLDKINSMKNRRKWKNMLPEICFHSSKMEALADNTERVIEAMKCAEYMSNHINEEYMGTIIDISSSGMVVQLDNLIEGRVRCKNLEGGYIYNHDTYSLLSLEGKEDYFIGDQVRVIVKDADKEKKLIDFKIKEKINDNSNINVKKQNELVKVKTKEKERERQERRKRKR